MASTTKHSDYLKRLTIDLRQTRSRVAELEAKSSEPVAVVGMGCRYPGGVGARRVCGRWCWGVGMWCRSSRDRGWDVDGLF